MLVLPEGVEIVSGRNETFIGNMGPVSPAAVNWTVVFPNNGSQSLVVHASGYDSNDDLCSIGESTDINVVPEFASFVALPLFVVFASLALMFCRKRRSQRLHRKCP